MKAGLLFGSFNPIHSGHLIIANYFSNYVVDEVWFIVSPQNPFKNTTKFLQETIRLQLVKLAIEDNTKFSAEDIEFQLARPSYTINTLKLLSEKYPEAEFHLIIGSDNFFQLHKWKSSCEIIENYKISVYERPNFLLPVISPHTNIQFIKAPLIDISSTLIRNMIGESKSIRYLVPDKVYHEINKKGYFK